MPKGWRHRWERGESFDTCTRCSMQRHPGLGRDPYLYKTVRGLWRVDYEPCRGAFAEKAKGPESPRSPLLARSSRRA